MASEFAGKLRKDLLERARLFAAKQKVSPKQMYLSRGATPVTLFKPHRVANVDFHHNFISSSYRSILDRADWRARLGKPHSKRGCLHPEDRETAKELDSCCSSDALLMNIFCYPALSAQAGFFRKFGFRSNPQVDFGFKPYLPFAGGLAEPRSSEIDLRLSTLERLVLCEAKLTEHGFTSKAIAKIKRYADFPVVFDVAKLPRKNNAFLHYQLIRNVLAAHHLDASFFLLFDERRSDLSAAFDEIRIAVKIGALKERLGRLTWQELARELPGDLQEFLSTKYGIN